MSTPLIVAASHCSDGPLASQVLYRAGLPIGDRLRPGRRGGARERFEDANVIGLHEKILKDNGLTWQVTGPSYPTVEEHHRQQIQALVEQRSGRHEYWGFQDPRACLFLEEWKKVAPRARVLMVYGNPTEVCRSMHRRYAAGMLRGTAPPRLHRGFWEVPDLALRMWLVYNRALLEFARAHPEAVIAVSLGMLREAFPLIPTLNDRWGFNLRRTQTTEIFTSTTAESNAQPVSDKNLVGETLKTWEGLDALGQETAEWAGVVPATGGRPTEEDFLHVPPEAYSLLMEAEFLGFKTNALGESLKESERARQELQARLDGNEHFLSPQRLARLEGAERDLRLIIERISRSKLAPIFRLKKEFQELEQRYLK